jgi:hypothetical protein
MPLFPVGRSGLAAVVLLAAAVHFTYFACSEDYFFPDSATYMDPAKTLSEGDGFGADEETPETMRTPGYPLLLAAFDRITPSPVPVIVTQHLLAVLLTAALYLLALRESGRRRVALLASILLALDTLTVHYANKVLSENLFTAVLFAVVLLALHLTRRPSMAGFILEGFLTGVLVLIRPLAVAYFAVLALFFFFIPVIPGTEAVIPGTDRLRPRRAIAAIVSFSLAAVVIPAGWALRNERETGVFTIASIAGTNLLLYRAAGALAIRDPGDFARNLARHQTELEKEVRARIRREGREDPDELPHAVLAQWYSRAATPVILAHPAASALLVARGVAVNLFYTDWDALALVSRLPPALIRWSVRVLTAALFPAAMAGLFILARENRALAMLIVLTCGYFLVISAGAEAEARFRAPIVPFYALAAAWGLDRAAGCVRDLFRRGIRGSSDDLPPHRSAPIIF